MERIRPRAVISGYRDDWRGLLAYACMPEAWTVRAFTCFAMAVGGFICLFVVDAVSGDSPIAFLPVQSIMAYWFVVRPVLRVAERRAARSRGVSAGSPSPSPR
jgi:hypothetical protein